MAVYPDKSRVALKPVADALGLDLLEAALSIQKIVEANMVNNLSEVSVWRGYDPREFAFIAFGGGAGLHALNMAAELGIRAVISPAYPAIVSALGHLVSDLKHFYSRTYVALIEDADLDTMNNFYAEIEREAQRTLRKEMTERGDIRLLRSIDIRYQWQLHELNVPTGRAPLRRADLRGLKQRFNKKHEEAYGYALPTYPVEIVALRLEAIGTVQAIQLRRREPAPSAKAAHAVRGTRDTYLPKTGRTRLKAYNRERLKPGTALQGPALVDGLEATILVPEQWQVTLDGYQNLVMERA
jgi:N-methylhydantoinase A